MKYFKTAVRISTKSIIRTMLIIIVVALILGLMRYPDEGMSGVLICLCVGFFGGLFGCFLRLINTMKWLEKSEEYREIFRTKGLCEELVQNHIRLYPNPAPAQLLERGSMCIALGDYSNAQYVYSFFRNIEALSNEERAFYLNDNLKLLLETGRVNDAFNLVQSYGNFLEKIYDGKAKSISYYDSLAALYAVTGNEQGAFAYCEKSAAAVESVDIKQRQRGNILSRCTKIKVNYILGRVAQADEVATETMGIIEAVENPEYVWTKDSYQRLVNNAYSFAQKYSKENKSTGSEMN